MVYEVTAVNHPYSSWFHFGLGSCTNFVWPNTSEDDQVNRIWRQVPVAGLVQTPEDLNDTWAFEKSENQKNGGSEQSQVGTPCMFALSSFVIFIDDMLFFVI